MGESPNGGLIRVDPLKSKIQSTVTFSGFCFRCSLVLDLLLLPLLYFLLRLLHLLHLLPLLLCPLPLLLCLFPLLIRLLLCQLQAMLMEPSQWLLSDSDIFLWLSTCAFDEANSLVVYLLGI